MTADKHTRADEKDANETARKERNEHPLADLDSASESGKPERDTDTVMD